MPLDIQFPTGKTTIDRSEQRLIILLDVSLSMTADDVVPSRFIVAKDLITTLIASIDHTEIALIVFSWLPVIDVPFTDDVAAFLSHVDDMTLADFPPTSLFVGTALGDALLVASDMVDDEQATSLLLITDGDNSQWLHPLRVIDDFIERDISVHTFAIGSETYQVGVDSTGNDVFAYIDLVLLEKIADATAWVFLHITPDAIGDTVAAAVEKMFATTKDIVLVEQHQAFNEWLKFVLLGALGLYFLIKIVVLIRIHALFHWTWIW